MSNFGHFSIPRSLLSDPVWKSLSYQYRHVFLTVLQHMAYKDIQMDDFGTLTTVKPFQFLTTKSELTKLCDEEDIDESLVYRVILKLKKLNFWNYETNHRKTLITITRDDILRTRELQIEPNSNQTRTKLEPQKNKDNKYNKDNKTNKPTPTPSMSGVEVVGSLVGFSVHGCLVSVGLTLAEQEELSREFSEAEVSRAVAVMAEYKKPISSVVGFLKKAIARGWGPRNPEAIKINLSSQAQYNRQQINGFKLTFIKELNVKDLVILDKGDHVSFGGRKAFYESETFNKEIAGFLQDFNLDYLIKKPQTTKVQNIAELQEAVYAGEK